MRSKRLKQTQKEFWGKGNKGDEVSMKISSLNSCLFGKFVKRICHGGSRFGNQDVKTY